MKLRQIRKKSNGRQKLLSGNDRFPQFIILWLVFLLPAVSGCVVSPSLKKENQPTPAPPESRTTSVERDIKSMQTADFDYIYVFRRKDGAPFESDDKKYLKLNSPPATNRFVLSDGDRAVVAGSSFKFEPENLMALEDRFIIENHSVEKNDEESEQSEQSQSNKKGP
ncbi:MAG: hypothetical protein R2747_14335 [Pyrinomonadaceae bacterium]